MTQAGKAEAELAGGFRRLRVVAKVRESATITSFHLEPSQPDGWLDYRPGQFLVFRIPLDRSGAFVLRNYSVSSCGDQGRYRISVKREPAAARDAPVGFASNFLHDEVKVGDELLAAGPRGTFVLDETSTRPVVLIGGGVGLTPLLAMFAKVASSSDRRAYFIHACDNGDVHALADEMRGLSTARAGLTLHFCYRFPTERDRSSRVFHSEGTVTRALLQSILPLDDYDFYLCGPPAFMRSVYGSLTSLGVPSGRIAYEFFGPATVLSAPEEAGEGALPIPDADGTAGDVMVEFRKSGRRAAWDDSAESLLDFAEKLGLTPDFSCRAGICSTCKSRLLSGEVSYFEEPLDAPQEDEVLLCCARPVGSVVVDI